MHFSSGVDTLDWKGIAIASLISLCAGLAKQIMIMRPTSPASPARRLPSAWTTSANAWLLITGSLYLIGALRGAVGEAAPMPDGTGAAPGLGRASFRGQSGSG